jgi:hypothetical protein
MEWTRQIPTEDGYYWFWGYIWGPPNLLLGETARLEQVQVRAVSNGIIYIGGGAGFDPRQSIGLWHRNDPPDPPKEQLQ